MKYLLTRKEALNNEVFSSFIGIWQRRFDPREDPGLTEAGNYHDWEIDQERWFSQLEIDEINKKELNEYLNRKDDLEIKKFDYFGELIYNLEYVDIFIYSIQLGKTLEKLSEELDSELIFILDYSVPWLYQKNEFPPVKNSLNYFRDLGVTDDFVGAFKFSGEKLAEFVSHLFWIIRCNASLPYCWFSTDNHEFVGYICKHGNIHIHTYSAGIKKQIKIFAKSNCFPEIDECLEIFDDSSGIEGRQIIL